MTEPLPEKDEAVLALLRWGSNMASGHWTAFLWPQILQSKSFCRNVGFVNSARQNSPVTRSPGHPGIAKYVYGCTLVGRGGSENTHWMLLNARSLQETLTKSPETVNGAAKRFQQFGVSPTRPPRIGA